MACNEAECIPLDRFQASCGLDHRGPGQDLVLAEPDEPDLSNALSGPDSASLGSREVGHGVRYHAVSAVPHLCHILHAEIVVLVRRVGTFSTLQTMLVGGILPQEMQQLSISGGLECGRRGGEMKIVQEAGLQMVAAKLWV